MSEKIKNKKYPSRSFYEKSIGVNYNDIRRKVKAGKFEKIKFMF